MKYEIEINENGKKTVIQPCMVPCTVERGMRVLGGKWKASILWHLKDEPVRFNDLTRMLAGASKKMIDQRLKELEKIGFIERQVLSQRPLAVVYQITDFGKSALQVLEQLKQWTENNGF